MCIENPIGYMEAINEGAYCNCWKDGQSYKDEEQINFQIP